MKEKTTIMVLQSPASLFNHARQRALFYRASSLFSKYSRALLNLEDVINCTTYSQRYGGLKSVDINLIHGTQGNKGGDFDCRFHPLTDRIRDRWVSVASAREKNIPLEAVQLIRVDESYFVVDGHHRISVARILGESAVDAEVTVLDIRL